MKTIRRALFTTLIILALPAGVLAGGLGSAGVAFALTGGQQYWVATNGVDSSCTPNNSAHPFATVGFALGCAAGDSTTASNPDFIHIAAGTYTGPGNEALQINANVVLLGAGQASTIINGGGNGSVLTNNGETVRMTNLTITNGSA